MEMDLSFVLIFLATAVNGIIAGITLDKALVNLPARHRIGVVNYATFCRGNDLGNGIILYPILGVCAILFTFAATIVFMMNNEHPLYLSLPIYSAVFFTIFHTFTTSQAAPIMLSIKKATDDEKILKKKFDLFEKWNTLRSIAQLLSFISMLWFLGAHLVRY